MRSPAEYYLKYLVSDKRRKIADILDEVTLLELNADENCLELLRRKLKFPRNYSPLDKTHKATKKFLKKEKIWGLWHPTVAVKQALKLYDIPNHRGTTYACILAGFTPAAIKNLLMEMFGLTILEETVVEFRHYLWNIDLVDRDDLARTFMSADNRIAIKPTLLTALRAPKNDVSGAHLLMYKLGFLPKSIDKLKALNTMRTLAYVNFVEASVFAQGRTKSEMLKNYSSVIKDMDGMISNIEQASDDVLGEFHKFVRIKKGDVEHRTIEEVAANRAALADVIDTEVDNDEQVN